jgi:hypothetical protein
LSTILNTATLLPRLAPDKPHTVRAKSVRRAIVLYFELGAGVLEAQHGFRHAWLNGVLRDADRNTHHAFVGRQ